MNRKDLTTLAIGAGIVFIAYCMKKQGFEGFQSMGEPNMGSPVMANPGPPMPPMGPMGPMTPGQPPMGPMGPMTPGQPMPPMAPGQLPVPPMPLTGQPPMPPGQPPIPLAGQPPQPMGMQSNQQQLVEIAAKVQRISGEQSAISSQLQQMTQSFMKEGFQSNHNPYNAASPGDTQAMEFRLGKKSLIDNVMRY